MNVIIPADFSEVTLKQVREFNCRETRNSIPEVYGSLPDSGLGAGRSASSLPQVSREQFESYVHTARDYGITFNYTFNGSCLGANEYDPSWREQFLSFVKYLAALGISAFTVSAPSLVAILRHQLPAATITASITADVRTRRGAIDYVRLGANKVMASISLHRRLKQLRHFAATPGIEVGILLNSFCFPDCTYRSEHFNTSSHLLDDEPSLYSTVGSFDFNQCALTKLTSPEQFLRAAWVRPEDVVHYENAGVSFFKLEGRQRQAFDAVKVATIYARRHYDGNLCSLHSLFSESNLPSLIHIDNRQLHGFLAKFMTAFPCDASSCDNCGHCADYARRAIRISDHEGLNTAIRRLRKELTTFVECGRR